MYLPNYARVSKSPESIDDALCNPHPTPNLISNTNIFARVCTKLNLYLCKRRQNQELSFFFAYNNIQLDMFWAKLGVQVQFLKWWVLPTT